MTTKFELFFNKIKEAAQCSTDAELARFLEINKSTLSMWKKREKVDYDLLFTKFEPLEVDYNWLFKEETAPRMVAEDVQDYKTQISESLNKDTKDDAYKIDVISSIVGKLYFKISDLEDELKEMKKIIHRESNPAS